MRKHSLEGEISTDHFRRKYSQKLSQRTDMQSQWTQTTVWWSPEAGGSGGRVGVGEMGAMAARKSMGHERSNSPGTGAIKNKGQEQVVKLGGNEGICPWEVIPFTQVNIIIVSTFRNVTAVALCKAKRTRAPPQRPRTQSTSQVDTFN